MTPVVDLSTFYINWRSDDLTVTENFLITIIFICMYSLRYNKKKYMPFFSLHDSITFNRDKTFILYKCYFTRGNFV